MKLTLNEVITHFGFDRQKSKFFDNFLSKDNWTGKNQSFFYNFLSKDVLTSVNQSFLITFFQRTFWPAKIKVFLISFFQRTFWPAKIKLFDYFLSKDNLTDKNQIFLNNFIWLFKSRTICRNFIFLCRNIDWIYYLPLPILPRKKTWGTLILLHPTPSHMSPCSWDYPLFKMPHFFFSCKQGDRERREKIQFIGILLQKDLILDL